MSPEDIILKVPNQYEKAKESGDLLFFPSTVVRHREPEVDIEFQIRVCPALQKKPQQITTPERAEPENNTVSISGAGQTSGGKASDPFEPPYNGNLYIGELKDENFGDDYVVLLNKYSVVPGHFLLVSKENKSQSSPLLPPDLVQTYKILVAARKTGKKYFAFYNCGNFSGASQSHKHVQFLPIDEGEAGPPIERLARSTNLETPSKPFTISKLPYANHVFRFSSELQYEDEEGLERTLADAFLSLLDLVVSTIRHASDYPAGKPSYNVILTLEHIHLIPRRYETYKIPETVHEVNVNSLGFAGMLLVKSDEELERVKSHGIGKILKGVALESVHEVQVAGTTDDAVTLASSHM
ncbi:HIT-like protein [Macrolepiota fuliginosa MF-IS2]|uniref:HIT-like protein n=1 Tax=Macrolepiota fuliginosa MF-IS2 TaxID=1400762 RepID=A0A9P5XJQ8_9AGAR|nr:HIT-like protein [Macrolepiota fuliginosa MF-IS2]